MYLNRHRWNRDLSFQPVLTAEGTQQPRRKTATKYEKRFKFTKVTLCFIDKTDADLMNGETGENAVFKGWGAVYRTK